MRGLRGVETVARDVRSNGALARIIGAYASFQISEFGIWIVLLVYAYRRGGPTGTTLVVLAQLVPAMVFAPYAGLLADRFSAAHVLLAGYLVQVVGLGAIAATVANGGPAAVVYALAALSTLGIDLVRPSQAAMLPGIARTPGELTTANVLTAWAEGAASLLGPAIAGIALGLGGVAPAVSVAATASFLSALLVVHGVAGAHAVPIAGAPDRKPTVLTGLRVAMGSPAVRVLVAFNGFYYVLVGALDVLCVVLAVSVLHIGSGAAGYLDAAIGGGATAAGLVTVLVPGRPRLAPLLAGALLVALGALALVGALPGVAVAVVLLAIVGLAGTVFVTMARTLLQRAAPPDAIATSFAVVETVMSVGLALGALLVRAGVAAVGLRAALFGPVVVGVLFVAIAWRWLRAVDSAANVPQVEIRLLRSIPIFASLPAPAIEGVARRLEPVTVSSGTAVVKEGEPGDNYYAIADGTLAVSRGGTVLRMLGRGTGFGEVALLSRARRTATVTATTDSHLFALRGDAFVEMLTGHARADEAVHRLVASYADPDLAVLDTGEDA